MNSIHKPYGYHFYWRPEMIKLKTTLNFVILFSLFFGLVFVIGCGGGAEKQAMLDFLKLYSDTVDEYAAADESKKAEIKEKLESFKSKWSNMEMELASKVTPQVYQQLEQEYEKITKKYASMDSHS
jgi:hypothetical protein